jgi:preprotein translocase subunit SecD
MKTTSILAIVFLLVLYSCNSGQKIKAQKVSFGIYETIKVKDVPTSVIDSITTDYLITEKDNQSPMVGYFLKDDTIHYPVNIKNENIKFIKTFYTIDKEGKYLGLVAVKRHPNINNSDIQHTKSKNHQVEIYFNLTGARKWADMTKNNIGNTVAFIINDKVYTMPKVMAEIRNGAALITGLEDEALANKISDSLNSSIAN